VQAGQLELNVMMPTMRGTCSIPPNSEKPYGYLQGSALMESPWMSDAANSMRKQRLHRYSTKSYIGYAAAAKIAQESITTGDITEIAIEPAAQSRAAGRSLDIRMTEPAKPIRAA
jgi:hypothetical protein